jgi:uncharacterized OsmC-like protein
MQESAKERSDASTYLETIAAVCVADDLTGLRKIRIRGWEYLSDSGAEMGGWVLAPSSPEYLLGVITSCLTHTYLIGAANRSIALERVEVKATSRNNDAHFFGLEQGDPRLPFDIRVRILVRAPDATRAELAELSRYATENCPVLQIIRTPNAVSVATEAEAV